MAAMTSKFNFECVIQYYTDQCQVYAQRRNDRIEGVVAVTTVSISRFYIKHFTLWLLVEILRSSKCGNKH